MQNNKIFININSHKDPSLPLTIMSALNNADSPENLVFGIGMAYAPGYEPNLDFVKDQAKIIRWTLDTIPGIVRGRYEVSKLITDEKYSLMIDSHTIFFKGWDTKAMAYLQEVKDLIGHENAIVSGTGYRGVKDPVELRVFEITRDGNFNVPSRKKMTLDENRRQTENLFESRFFDCSFTFTEARYYTEVGFDSISHFISEEPYASIKSWVNGWDIFTPFKSVANQSPEYYFNILWNGNVSKRKYARDEVADSGIITLEMWRAIYGNVGAFASKNPTRSISDFWELYGYSSREAATALQVCSQKMFELAKENKEIRDSYLLFAEEQEINNPLVEQIRGIKAE